MKEADKMDVVNALPAAIACIRIGSPTDADAIGFSVWEEDKGEFWFPSSEKGNEWFNLNGVDTATPLDHRVANFICKLNEVLANDKNVALGFDFPLSIPVLSGISDSTGILEGFIPLRGLAILKWTFDRLASKHVTTKLLNYDKFGGHVLIWEAKVSAVESPIIDMDSFLVLTEKAHQDWDRDASIAVEMFKSKWVSEGLPLFEKKTVIPSTDVSLSPKLEELLSVPWLIWRNEKVKDSPFLVKFNSAPPALRI